MTERVIDQQWSRITNENQELLGFTRSVCDLIAGFDTTITIRPPMGIYECIDSNEEIGITRELYKSDFGDDSYKWYRLIDYQGDGYSRDIQIQEVEKTWEAFIAVDLERGFDWPIRANYSEEGWLNGVTIQHESSDADEMRVEFELDPYGYHIAYAVDFESDDATEEVTSGKTTWGNEVVIWNRAFSIHEDDKGLTTFSIRRVDANSQQLPIEISFPPMLDIVELYCQISSENPVAWQSALDEIPTVVRV
jgi:hypothetical protein